ncbi:pyroglutamyl-peptidase I [Thermosipho atlanticus]|uniref:Pyrrolidone-carboxylate peptidase n=1 Tax=Thermosipho atlanticus DSM 15807 TaxID=1123380 RepID=A0A1M5TUS4_9BACT|nr:pyroglutamyl-peptidase I [Thermosipho atlanticus]SHH54474.1 pyroglutamyl-peptidase I . Cysteine peptidase. MEROPS family C15 [Thermosipho atlanticus DSM 15807]
MKILLTGFDPFNGEKINPSWEAIKRFPKMIGGANILKTKIPTVFYKSIQKLEEIIEKERPNIVICVGQAGGRTDITVERVAININDAKIPDNEKNQLIDTPIFEDGKNAYFSNLPIKAIVKEIRKNNIPASISNTAGTFVCNHLMYGLLYLIDKKYPNIKGGFIHVPYIHKQVLNKPNIPSMSLKDIIKGLKIAVVTSIKFYNKQDIEFSDGKIS